MENRLVLISHVRNKVTRALYCWLDAACASVLNHRFPGDSGGLSSSDGRPPPSDRSDRPHRLGPRRGPIRRAAGRNHGVGRRVAMSRCPSHLRVSQAPRGRSFSFLDLSYVSCTALNPASLEAAEVAFLARIPRC